MKKREKQGSRWNPFRYGMLSWLWKCYISPFSWPPAMFGYTPAEDIPLRANPVTWEMVLLPHFKFEHPKILKIGNQIFVKYLGADDDYVAKGLAAYTEAMSKGEYFDIWDHFMITVTEEEREDILNYLEKNPQWVVHFDEKEKVHRIEHMAVSANAKLAAVKRIRQESIEAVAHSKDVGKEMDDTWGRYDRAVRNV